MSLTGSSTILKHLTDPLPNIFISMIILTDYNHQTKRGAFAPLYFLVPTRNPEICHLTLPVFFCVLNSSYNTFHTLDIQKIAVFFQCSVCIMSQHPFCQNFSELNAFLIETVDIPQESLEHDLVLEVS